MLGPWLARRVPRDGDGGYRCWWASAMLIGRVLMMDAATQRADVLIFAPWDWSPAARADVAAIVVGGGGGESARGVSRLT